MAGGLAGLLDDVAALAKLAAASVDDVGAAAGRASAKAAGVVVDDTAVTPAYVRGLAAERELPIIKRIAVGSLRNKLLIILPLALVLSAIAPTLVEVILMLGGTYLCFEGAEKIYHRLKHDDHDHDVPVAMQGPDAEEKTIKGAIRTDLILSAEIMVIALKEVIDEALFARAVILVIVALLITAIVYGVVALIVKMDDVGLALAGRDSEVSRARRPDDGRRDAEGAVDPHGRRHRGHALGRWPHPPGRRRGVGVARTRRLRARPRAPGRRHRRDRWRTRLARQHPVLCTDRLGGRLDRRGDRVAPPPPRDLVLWPDPRRQRTIVEGVNVNTDDRGQRG